LTDYILQLPEQFWEVLSEIYHIYYISIRLYF